MKKFIITLLLFTYAFNSFSQELSTEADKLLQIGLGCEEINSYLCVQISFEDLLANHSQEFNQKKLKAIKTILVYNYFYLAKEKVKKNDYNIEEYCLKGIKIEKETKVSILINNWFHYLLILHYHYKEDKLLVDKWIINYEAFQKTCTASELNLIQDKITDYNYVINQIKKGIVFSKLNFSKKVDIAEKQKHTEAVLKSFGKTLYFDLKQTTLNDKQKVKLNGIATIMKEYPNANFHIDGHSYKTGNTALSNSITAKRVKNVMDYLLSKGVSPNQLKGEGFGDAYPIATNQTITGQKKNSRVEIYLVK